MNQRSQVRRSTRARAATWVTVCTSPGERSASSSTQRSWLGSGASAPASWSSSCRDDDRASSCASTSRSRTG